MAELTHVCEAVDPLGSVSSDVRFSRER